MIPHVSNLDSTIIDLGTYDLIDESLYSGADANNYFARQHRKSTWFSYKNEKIVTFSAKFSHVTSTNIN